MTSAVTPGIFFLMVLAAGPLCRAYQCRLPLPGKCSTSNYTIENGTVCPAAKADCNFTTAEGLCDYRQGCKDSVMTNWTVENGVLKANQRTAGSCSGVDFYYSVLECPWLEFTAESCLQFQYRRYNPAALDVFLALHNGSVLTVLDRTSNTGYDVWSTDTWTVPPGVGKVKFRAYGGGGGGNVEVRSVSVSPGHCGSSGLSSVNTEPTTGNCRRLTAATTTTRTLPMASTKNQDAFSRSTSPKTTTPPTASANNQGTAPRRLSTSPYASETSLPSSSHARNTGVSTDTIRDNPDNKSSDGDGGGSNVAVIAGAVAAAVVIAAAVVVAVVIFYRRRSGKGKHDERNGNVEDMSEIQKGKDNFLHIAGPGDSGDNTVGRSHSKPTPSPAAANYVNVDGLTSHIHDADMDDYDLAAEDGAPGQRRQPGRNNYRYINTSGALKHGVSPHPDGAVVEDDYSHIDSAHNNPQTRGTFEDDYNHIDNPPNPVGSSGNSDLTGRQPNANDVYSVVNKNGKTPTQPNTNDVYSVVNKTPKVASKPALWGKPGVGTAGSVANGSGRPTRAEDKGVPPDDYNTLSFSETRNQSAKAVGSGHKAYDHVTTDPADPYSKTRTGKPNVVIGSDYDHVKN